ncbi:MAG: hypothetical protein ACHQT7_00370 [Candidatus Levyibacteriota bacterium]
MGMRRKIERDEEFMDGEVVEAWSRRRIIVALVILLALGIGGFLLFGKVKDKAVQVLGIASGPRITPPQDIKLPTQEDAANLLDRAKQELNNLTSENLSASQASGLQKVIQDLQSIKSGSGSAVGVFCDLVCKK